jgi:hypothetical protein
MGIDFSGDADAATTSYCGTTSFRNVRVADSLRVDSNADMAEEVEQVRGVTCSEVRTIFGAEKAIHFLYLWKNGLSKNTFDL